MLRANIFSFFSKKKIFFKRQGKKREFFLWDFLLLQMCGIIIFVFFFLLFSLSFRIQLCMYVVVDSKKLSLRLRFHFIFSIRFLCFRFFLKENFSAFFWFHSFFLFCFCFKIFMFSTFFFLSREGEDSQKLTFFQNWHKKITLKITKNKQIDA